MTKIQKTASITLMQLHGFSDAFERAYAGVIYLRMSDASRGILPLSPTLFGGLVPNGCDWIVLSKQSFHQTLHLLKRTRFVSIPR